MYLYLYAPFLKHKKYASDLAIIEGLVTDFGISGKVAQLSQFLKLPAAIKEFGVKRLATIVVVGDDVLLEEAINNLAMGAIVLGYIPIGESIYARALGIPIGPKAVQTLAARRITRLDLGRVGSPMFLGTLKVEGRGMELHSPTFSIFPEGLAVIEIINCQEGADADDGLLEVSITPIQGRFRPAAQPATRLKVSSCRLKAERPVSAIWGLNHGQKLPLQVDIVPKAVKMIVGRREGVGKKVRR